MLRTTTFPIGPLFAVILWMASIPVLIEFCQGSSIWSPTPGENGDFDNVNNWSPTVIPGPGDWAFFNNAIWPQSIIQVPDGTVIGGMMVDGISATLDMGAPDSSMAVDGLGQFVAVGVDPDQNSDSSLTLSQGIFDFQQTSVGAEPSGFGPITTTSYLEVEAGATWRSASTILGLQPETTGIAVLDGGKAESDAVIIGNLGEGTFTIQNGGELMELTDGISSGSIGQQIGSTGTVNVTGIDSSWSIDLLTVGDVGHGTLSVESEGQAHVNSILIASSGESLGSSVEISGTGSLLNADLSAEIRDGGSVSLSMGGTMNIGAGTGTEDSVNVHESGRISGGGTIHGGLLNHAGTVAPGSSAGKLTVDGQFEQMPEGLLKIEIGGLDAGTKHDQIVVTGSASLGGTIDVTLLDDYSPDPGDRFTILLAESVADAGVSLAADDLADFKLIVQAASVLLEAYTAIPGDFNADGDVDHQDLTQWRAAFGATDQGDADGDGDSDGWDMLIWQQNITGAAGSPAAALTVPEPSVFRLLLGFALIGLFSMHSASANRD